MSEGIRLLRPERDQFRWEMVDLDSQLPPEHPARIVWKFVEGQDLGAFYARIKARAGEPGRPAADPAVLLALWLFATLDGEGSARAIERLCNHHAAYRWICGGVPANHDMLSQFRRDDGDRLDALLTRSLSGLIDEGLLTIEEISVDGTKTCARAGYNSLAGGERLTRIQAAVGARIARLRQELELDPGRAERQRRDRALRAAEQQAARIARAEQRLRQYEAEQAERAKQDKRAAKRPPKVSLSDPEVRQMRMADGATRPAWNVQVATAAGFIVGIEPTERRNDSGLAPGMLAQVEQRCGCWPERLLADQTAMRADDIAAIAELAPDLRVYSPVPEERAEISPAGARNRRSQRRREPFAVQEWRQRMTTEAARLVYRRRKLTERVRAMMKNRGFGRMAVHGLATVRVVCLLHAIAHNLLHAHSRRLVAVASA